MLIGQSSFERPMFFARLVTCFALVFISARVAHSAIVSMPLDVIQQAKADGSVEYQVQVLPFPFGPVSARAIAPDGTEFHLPDPTGPGLQQLEGLTFADFASRCFGVWTIREVPLFGGGVPAEYQFTFSPFALDSLFHDPPHIVAPADDATVGLDFLVEWAYDSGATPGSRLTSLRGDPKATVEFAPSPLSQATLHVDLTGASSNQLTIRAGSLASLSDYVGPVNPVGVPGPNQYSLRCDFFNLSAPVTVTVVPEPSALGLVLVGGGLLCAWRFWRRGLARRS
jgi:PEP-CTERM motif